MKKIEIPRSTRSLVYIIAAFLLLPPHIIAQKNDGNAIKGTVTSAASNTVLSGANVYVKGTQFSVTADKNGAYSIVAKAGDVLVVSYVGFNSKEIKINTSNSTINIQLEEDPNYKLQDVVVVGYGKMKKSHLSSSVVTVSNADIGRTVNVTLDEALQGKAPNVYVSQTSGQPGAGASIIIRGVSTITGNYQPLYVIDGVQLRPTAPIGGAYNQPASETNALAGLNPEDIESISVLQGPAASSIYGQAGSNGVLMITTKHGKSGTTKVSASTLYSIQDKPTKRPVMNLKDYATYIGRLQKLGLVGIEPPELADPTLLGEGTDWQNALFRRTVLQKHAIAVSGGTDKSSFYFSGDYLSQDGIAIGSGFKRGSVRINLDNQASKWLKFGTSLNVYTTKEKVNTTNGNIINLAITQNPTIPVKNADGSWGGPMPAQVQYSQTNPVALASLNNNYNTSFGVLGNLYMDVSPIKGLVWHTETDGNYSFNNNFTFNPSYTAGEFVNANTQGSRASGNSYWISLQTRLQYEFNYRKHYIMLMAGHEGAQSAYEGLSGAGQNYSTNSIQELSVAAPLTQQTSSYRGRGSNESYFSRLNYSYQGKYIAQFSFRRDANSNFINDNLWGNFPAASVAWKISEEGFMKNSKIISDLKLRAEYGISGNVGNSGGAVYSNLYSAATPWGGGFLPSNFPNPNLRWEEDKAANVGFDLYMLNNKIEVIADAYEKNISNLIMIASNSGVYGGNISGGYGGLITWPVQNVGGMQNRGFGITINTLNIATKDFKWKTGVNFSMDRNKVTSLISPLITQYISSTNNGQAQFITQVGQPLSMYTGYIAEGIFENYKDISSHAVQTSNGVLTIDPSQGSWVGDVKFKDVSGPNGKPDGIIDNYDRTIIGNPWPKFTYNFNSNFSYKGFELNLFFTGVYGNSLLNLTRYQNEMPLGTGPYSNHYKVAADFAVPSSLDPADALTVTLLNPGTTIYRPAPTDANGNVRLNQWHVEDGSYLKLKNARLSYRVASKILSRTNAIRGILATIQVQNAFTITKYKGFDPEVGMYNYKGVTNIVGLDEGRYPSTRSYSFSLALDF